jgi:hypothetical protein
MPRSVNAWSSGTAERLPGRQATNATLQGRRAGTAAASDLAGFRLGEEYYLINLLLAEEMPPCR